MRPIGGAGTVNIRDIVAFGAQRRIGDEAEFHIDRQTRAARALGQTKAKLTAAVLLGGRVPLLLVLISPHLLTQGRLTTGTVLGAITYLAGSLEPSLRSLVHAFGSSGLWLTVALEQITKTKAPPPSPTSVDDIIPRDYDLRLHHVTFAHGPSAEPILRDFNLTIPHGEHLAIVGQSGIGKSTLANLITGIVRPQCGWLTIGGVTLENIREQRLRRTIALIPQEAYIFAGTLRENLTYLNPSATNADLDEAADALGIRPLIDRLGGYLAALDEATVLSAGERQLIALTRVYLSAAEVIVLDEATCHLGPSAEARAEKVLARRRGTLIVIAHRISSAMRAKRILVMDCQGTSGAARWRS
jgi:ATP-binding cassette, subfamily C, bacterial